MAEDNYFQFPLCALAFGDKVEARLNAIMDYSLVEAGWRLLQKLTMEQQQQFFHDWKLTHKVPKAYNSNAWTHRSVVYGAHIIGVTLGDFETCIQKHALMKVHVTEFEARHGTDAKVRIKRGWLFDARDHHGITYREFAVLCAIYSVIGDKQMVQVTRETIRRRALGYRSAAIMQAELSNRADTARPLTERQLRDTVERLHRNKFFARRTYARRITYYSNRLDNEAIQKAIIERRTYPAHWRASQAAQDQALTDAIKKRRREAAATVHKTAPSTPRLPFTPPS